MIAHVNGIDLFYEKAGEGRPLLLVHGNGEDHTIFDEAAAELAGSFTCYAVDSRCHGQSGGEFHVAGGQRNECDLRGMNVEEGILELERHIDRCMRQGLDELTVIHGKGTGVLRKGIQDFLRKNKYAADDPWHVFL